ncbi:hypothetical protein MSI_9360 [Treponema sp. JC4]|uniref:hypothetical protein n=1 Tax=Treponema sp. JC4 TaxID=1124982 RepID=UPI00025B02A8|nr:hypothetical protein [Treponema sp. JC4]EID85505.1 hypothetical protein MSI_9360 [Treponema sp. JC4]
MKLRHFFALGFCFLTFGFSKQLYAQDMGEVDEAVIEESGEVQSEAVEKKPNIFVRTANIFMNLPFGYDLGCEPTLHGSLTYFNLKYRWSDEKQIFSRLLFNYGTTLDVNHSSVKDLPSKFVHKYEKEDKAVDFKLIPWGKSVFFQKEKTAFFTIEPGLNFRMEFETVQATIKAEGKMQAFENVIMLYDIYEKENRYIIRPYYSTSIFLPVAKPVSVTFDVLYSPVYFYWTKANVQFDINYYKDMYDKHDPSPDYKYSFNTKDSLHSQGMAENYIDANLIFSLFNAFALSGRFMYERKHTDEYNLSNDLTIVKESSQNKYDIFSLKFGGSLINIGKADMRIKTGVFYQWDWKFDNNRDNWEREGKWIFGVGMRNLY